MQAHHGHSVPFEAATLVPLVAPVRVEQLRELSTWMALDGHRVNLGRLCIDRVYALEVLALAHASELDPLRELAMTLFAAFERRDLPVAS